MPVTVLPRSATVGFAEPQAAMMDGKMEMKPMSTAVARAVRVVRAGRAVEGMIVKVPCVSTKSVLSLTVATKLRTGRKRIRIVVETVAPAKMEPRVMSVLIARAASALMRSV